MRWWPLLGLVGCTTETAIPNLDDVSTTGGGPGGASEISGDAGDPGGPPDLSVEAYGEVLLEPQPPYFTNLLGDENGIRGLSDQVVSVPSAVLVTDVELLPPSDEVLTPIPIAGGALVPLGNPEAGGEVRLVTQGDLVTARVEVTGLWAGSEHAQSLVLGSCDDLASAETIAIFEDILSDHNGPIEWEGSAILPEPDLEGTAWVIYGADEGGLWDPGLPAACADIEPDLGEEDAFVSDGDVYTP